MGKTYKAAKPQKKVPAISSWELAYVNPDLLTATEIRRLQKLVRDTTDAVLALAERMGLDVE